MNAGRMGALRLDEDRQAVVNGMVALGEPETKTQIRAASGIGTSQRFDQALGSLIRDKTIKAVELKKGTTAITKRMPLRATKPHPDSTRINSIRLRLTGCNRIGIG